MNEATLTMEGLEDSLMGVFDLKDAGDCRTVIKTLLRDLNAARGREAKAVEETKTLALMALNMSPDLQRKAREVVVDASKSKGRDVMAFLLEMAGEMDKAKDMDDERLAQEVLDRVWGSFDMRGKESALLGELLERFNGSKDVLARKVS